MNRLFSSMSLADARGGSNAVGLQRTGDEPDYQARVNDSLKDAQLKDVKADWNATRRRCTCRARSRSG